MDGDNGGEGEDGFGAVFWLMLCLGIVGVLGFFFVAGGYFLGIIFLSFLLLGLNESDNQQEGIRWFLFILPIFFCLMGFIGGLFLFISGLFKKD